MSSSSSAVEQAVATTVKLASGDGFAFIVDKAVAEQSPTIKNMLDVTRGGAFTEALTNQISFPEIKGKVLEKVCQYLIYKYRYAAEGSTERVPEFKFDLELSLELLMAADYLDC
ncbi:elongin C [Coemansia thaxteri]|uniref:Elongin-C n=1 Tax=Coemansia thaxteri TaxID=2663907 RepID=A0A9W8BHJ3_9FUNG|nr:elongin C [Coemansia thaxteri]KAJ2002268.1 elongin C [Coemansia thaxteri]KAJ2462960.1 elongin C [Coemansia sp. RSA 2322]KAJ2477804.1 elongin C [Coemansia sp. RSA 2320]